MWRNRPTEPAPERELVSPIQQSQRPPQLPLASSNARAMNVQYASPEGTANIAADIADRADQDDATALARSIHSDTLPPERPRPESPHSQSPRQENTHADSIPVPNVPVGPTHRAVTWTAGSFQPGDFVRQLRRRQ